ncbi:MAG: hypothetical protein QNJ51_02380 [Calothrix sp. MO_167.B12]|nr:hypothetical protein [Calothrix sp. MO_167.B12]
MNYYIAQAIYARKNLDRRLDDVLDTANRDKNLSPDIKDDLTNLRCNAALELTSIALKFRQQLQKSKYAHAELKRAIRFLEYDIQRYSNFFDVNTLFLLAGY